MLEKYRNLMRCIAAIFCISLAYVVQFKTFTHLILSIIFATLTFVLSVIVDALDRKKNLDIIKTFLKKIMIINLLILILVLMLKSLVESNFGKVQVILMGVYIIEIAVALIVIKRIKQD